MTITLDYNNMLRPRLGGAHGITPERLESLAPRFAEIHREVGERRERGELGFFELPFAGDLVEEIARFAEGPGQSFENIVILGIGGSALGTIALRTALLDPFWNELESAERDFFPRLYVLDNIDPFTFGSFLRRIDLRRTLFNVVSKSGGTAETMGQFMILRQLLETELGEGFRRHLLFTTDPERGVLRRLAREEGIAALPIPANVGGRFSVFSAVGLLPAALVGIPVREMLDGARDMDDRCRTSELRRNPAGVFASLQWLADRELGAPIHVMMPYSDRLRDVADWFRQLWAESLGKQKNLAGDDVFVGPTPVRALGATDQHSQVQLYMEGPFDKTICFLSVRESQEDVSIPPLYADIEELGYLGGQTLGALLRTEMEATAAALAQRGRMNMTLELPSADARSVGGLLHLLQIATVYAGALYGIDPLDQPGVELGKQLTYALMGRPGFDHRPGERALPEAGTGDWVV